MILKDTNVFITGGSSGIGFALVKAFLQEGAKVSFTYRSSDSLIRSKVKDILDNFSSVNPICADFSKPINSNSLITSASDFFNEPINVLINNAAAFSRDKFLNTSIETLREILDVNLVAPFMLISEFSKALIKAGKEGSIINISSLSAIMARSEMSAYQCSKAGLEMLSNSVAYELARYKIRSNIIAPGLTETEANQNQRVDNSKIWNERAANIPLGRAGQPEDYIGAAIYFASNQSQWVTGSKIIVDGGLSTY